MLISDGQHFHEKKQLNGKLYLTSIIEEVKGVDTVRRKSRTLIGAIPNYGSIKPVKWDRIPPSHDRWICSGNTELNKVQATDTNLISLEQIIP